MKYLNQETMKLQDCHYVKAEENAEAEQKVETKKRTRKKEV